MSKANRHNITISRSAALAGLSTAALAGAAASSPAIAAMPDNPDQCFLDWWAAYLVAEREALYATTAADKAEFAAKAAFPPRPDHLQWCYKGSDTLWPMKAADIMELVPADQQAGYLEDLAEYERPAKPSCRRMTFRGSERSRKRRISERTSWPSASSPPPRCRSSA